MGAFISFIFRIIHGDLYATARHRLTTGGAVALDTARVTWMRRWTYRRPDYRWMDARNLMQAVRARDASSDTRPMRWWEQEMA